MSYEDFKYYIGVIKSHLRNKDFDHEGTEQICTALIRLLAQAMRDYEGLIYHYIVVLHFGDLAEEEIGDPSNVRQLYEQLKGSRW